MVPSISIDASQTSFVSGLENGQPVLPQSSKFELLKFDVLQEKYNDSRYTENWTNSVKHVASRIVKFMKNIVLDPLVKSYAALRVCSLFGSKRAVDIINAKSVCEDIANPRKLAPPLKPKSELLKPPTEVNANEGVNVSNGIEFFNGYSLDALKEQTNRNTTVVLNFACGEARSKSTNVFSRWLNGDYGGDRHGGDWENPLNQGAQEESLMRETTLPLTDPDHDKELTKAIDKHSDSNPKEKNRFIPKGGAIWHSNVALIKDVETHVKTGKALKERVEEFVEKSALSDEEEATKLQEDIAAYKQNIKDNLSTFNVASVAAPNLSIAGSMRDEYMGDNNQISAQISGKELENSLVAVLKKAQREGCTTAILGAIGTGIFANHIDVVAAATVNAFIRVGGGIKIVLPFKVEVVGEKEKQDAFIKALFGSKKIEISDATANTPDN